MTSDVTDSIILVIDDEEPNVLLLQRLLRSGGYFNVVATTDPRQAIPLVQQHSPDLVLLDLHMPHLDGFAVMKALGAEMAADDFVPVLVLTADWTHEAREQVLGAGAKDFLTKPFDRTEVLLRIRNLLDTRALHTRLQRHRAVLADQVREHEEGSRLAAEDRRRRVARIEAVLTGSVLAMVFQPIVSLAGGEVVGFEALARFDAEPRRTPDLWFAEAASVGLGGELELSACRAAIAVAGDLPADAYLAVNISPQTVTSAAAVAAFADAPLKRLVIEITEHAHVDDYDELTQALGGLRRRGARVSVDDAGAGFASLQHILRLRPDIIKLDISLTRGVHVDPVRQALASLLVSFAAEIGSTITAEGIEEVGELDRLRQLGVYSGQGYHLGRPGPLPRHEDVNGSSSPTPPPPWRR